jgi:hypothetical protein
VQPTRRPEVGPASRCGANRPKTRTASRCGANRPKTRTASRCGANRPQTRTASRCGAYRNPGWTETRSCSRSRAYGSAEEIAGTQTDEVCGDETEVRFAGGIPFS